MLLFSRSVMSDSFATPWTVVCQGPVSMGFPRQEYWSGLPFLSPGGFPDPGIEPLSPALAGGFFTTEPQGKPLHACVQNHFSGIRLCSPVDYSPPGSSVRGILQARILKWVAISFSMGSSQPRKWTPGLLPFRQILYPLSYEGRS